MANSLIKSITEKTVGVATDEFVINDVANCCLDKRMSMDGIRITGSQVTDLTSSITESFVIAAGDETTVLCACCTTKTTFRMPYAFTVTAVRASLTTAGTGAALVTVDINEAGTSILSTKLTVDACETTSQTAATPAVISDSSLADDAVMTIDVDTIDTCNTAAGLKVYIIGNQT